MCAPHDDEHRRNDRESKRRRRRRARRSKTCLWCSRKAVRGVFCLACKARKRAARARAVALTPPGREDRIAARTAVDGDNRVRYHGQDGRGGMPRKVVDRQDLVQARLLIDKAIAGYDVAVADDAAPRAIRKAAVDVALGKADHAKRFIDAVFERNGYESEELHGE